jgi:hypothetical protein
LLLFFGNTEIMLQAINCRKLFGGGSPHLIHGKIIALLTNRVMRRVRRGSFKVKLSPNGSPPDRVFFYG